MMNTHNQMGRKHICLSRKNNYGVNRCKELISLESYLRALSHDVTLSLVRKSLIGHVGLSSLINL